MAIGCGGDDSPVSKRRRAIAIRYRWKPRDESGKAKKNDAEEIVCDKRSKPPEQLRFGELCHRRVVSGVRSRGLEPPRYFYH